MEVKENWIKVTDDMFICSECENHSHPETNSVDGIVQADISKITEDLKQYPGKTIYGICPVCGMEYTFKYVDGQLYLAPSELQK